MLTVSSSLSHKLLTFFCHSIYPQWNLLDNNHNWLWIDCKGFSPNFNKITEVYSLVNRIIIYFSPPTLKKVLKQGIEKKYGKYISRSWSCWMNWFSIYEKYLWNRLTNTLWNHLDKYQDKNCNILMKNYTLALGNTHV